MSSISVRDRRSICSTVALPDDPASRAAISVTLVMATLLVPTLLALAFDNRQFNGIDIWIKPMHFELAIAVHFASLIVFLRLVNPQGRASAAMRWSMNVAAFAALCEIGYISLQAARGRGSHFNTTTPIESMSYALAGVGAVMIVVGSFVAGVEIWRQGRSDVGAGLRLGAILGLTLGSVATLIVAGTMSAGILDGPGHWVRGVHSDANGLPFFGWSTTGGDLRTPHFFATHTMQALPIAGWVADCALRDRATQLVWAATGLWGALVVGTFAMALAGKSFLSL
jgi:hypothetical protein